MKKKQLLFIFLTSMSLVGQVGIGTIAPQESLHVGGNTSTIRVEGLDDINNSLNLGSTKLTPVFINYQGNFTLLKPIYTSGDTGYVLPLNFLKYDTNFVANNPLGLPIPFDKYGVVVNSDLSNESETAIIEKLLITMTTNSMIEVKYALSLYFSSSDLTNPPYASEITDKKTRVVQTYFCIDINDDGLIQRVYLEISFTDNWVAFSRLVSKTQFKAVVKGPFLSIELEGFFFQVVIGVGHFIFQIHFLVFGKKSVHSS